MATPFPFELVAPDRLLFSGQVDGVVVPAIEGEMTVLAGHAPVMTVLKCGIVIIDDGKNTATRMFVRGGFADVRPDGLTILAEQAMPLEELHDEFIDLQIAQAQDAVDAAQGDEAKRAAAERLTQLREVKSVLES